MVELDIRPILLAMNDPRSSSPRHALYPYPNGCIGWRLWQLLCRRVRVSRLEYLEAFDRRNLVTGPWSMKRARREAKHLQSTLKGRTIILLGDGPRRAFGLPRLLLHPQTIAGVTWRQIPHLSGRNRFYDDPMQADLVAMLLESLYLRWKAEKDARQSRSQCLSSPAGNGSSYKGQEQTRGQSRRQSAGGTIPDHDNLREAPRARPIQRRSRC